MELLAMEEQQQQCNTQLCLGWYTGETKIIGNKRKFSPAVKIYNLFSPEENEDGSSVKEKVSSESSGVENRDTKILQVHKTAEGSSSSSFNMQRKLKLTKEQAALLEDSFRQHQTLNSTQKHDLAKRLSLLPRQVEVWFQNKRARTKLKQTEVDYEFLKKCCENLREENLNLKRELQELKSVRIIQPFYAQKPCDCSKKIQSVVDVKLKFDCKAAMDSSPAC